MFMRSSSRSDSSFALAATINFTISREPERLIRSSCWHQDRLERAGGFYILATTIDQVEQQFKNIFEPNDTGAKAA